MTGAEDDVVDLAFALEGSELPRAYRADLAKALLAALPWIALEPSIAVHRLNLSAGAGPRALLSRRTRLTLRLPRAQAARARELIGQQLAIGECRLRVGDAQERELLPFHTLYAHLVVLDASQADDELTFQRAVESLITARGVACRAIFGRRQVIEDGALRGAPVMLDGLSAPTALCIMREGLGDRRLLGCGVFVPHKSAAAVGSTS